MQRPLSLSMHSLNSFQSDMLRLRPGEGRVVGLAAEARQTVER